MGDDSGDGVGAAFQESFDRQAASLKDVVTPLIGADDRGRPYVVGSAVLIRFKGVPFLVTACHVLDDNKGVAFHYDGDGTPTPLGATFEVERRRDLAAWRLPHEAEQALSVRYGFLDDSRFGSLPAEPPKTYAAAVGFPATKARLPFNAKKIVSQRYSIADFVEKHGKGRVGIRFRKKRVTLAAKRQRQSAPDPYGMSGGAILAMPVTMKALAGPDSIFFAGIATDWIRKESRMEGTTAEVVTAFLAALS